MKSSEPSNPKGIAAVLKSRGFLWKTSRVEDVISNSSSLSFDDEWTKFIKIVQDITGLISTTYTSQNENFTIAAEVAKETDADAHQVLFDAISPGQATPERTAAGEASSASSAWNFFKHVIDPKPANLGLQCSCPNRTSFVQQVIEPGPPNIVQQASDSETATLGHKFINAPFSPGQEVIDTKPTYLGPQGNDPDPANVGREDERLFNIALFQALRASLNGYVDQVVDENWIVLRNSIIGFGRNIKRGSLGFRKGYVLSGNSESDHGCFVLGAKMIENLKATNTERNSVQGKVHKTLKKRKISVWYTDMTATVELKLESSSCACFTRDGNTLKNPKLATAHGPMGQAIMYSMDMWHCLARRGVTVESLPVVVLARKTGAEPKRIKICCLEAHVQVPKYCGTPFKYSIDRIVSFDGTTGLTKAEAMSDIESRDKRAIAIYIRTMRIGLENADKIRKNRKMVNPVPPVSLCCRNLLRGVSCAKLIASPIPCEEYQWITGLKISQGELFHLSSPTKTMFSGLGKFHWFVASEERDVPLTNDCIVKVSCASVHNYYVHPSECKDALNNLFYEGSTKLKEKISEVLLGYCYTGKTVISVMKDLRTGDKPFKLLELRSFRGRKRYKLWKAFRRLVKSLLLPMADANVIHLDIRSSSEFTYNILVYEDVNEVDCKLQLIDFDSVVLYSDANSVDDEGQSNAIWWNKVAELVSADEEGHDGDIDSNSVVVEGVSAYQYLFWQVLWIAYRWHQHMSEELTTDLDVNANNFVSFLFQDDVYVEFKDWLGKYYKTLKRRSSQIITRKDIRKALRVLKKVFKEKCC
jgi:hypothetical protein